MGKRALIFQSCFQQHMLHPSKGFAISIGESCWKHPVRAQQVILDPHHKAPGHPDCFLLLQRTGSTTRAHSFIAVFNVGGLYRVWHYSGFKAGLCGNPSVEPTWKSGAEAAGGAGPGSQGELQQLCQEQKPNSAPVLLLPASGCASTGSTTLPSQRPLLPLLILLYLQALDFN